MRSFPMPRPCSAMTMNIMNSPSRSDLKACHARLRSGSRTFHAASFLLPRQYRDPAVALYAFCRVADDAIDLGEDRQAALADLQDRLVAIYSGRPAPYPEDRAFAWVVNRLGIPRTLPEALLEGFRWDIENRRYQTGEDLYGYATRVAGTVGAMMSIIMGVRTPAAIARACELGMAMQLTNIARDVGEDARAGRLYLPRQWLLEAGIDPEAWLQAPVFSAALAGVVKRVLQAADSLYSSAEAGLGLLPPSCRTGIRSAGLVYREIGRDVERGHLDSVTRRAVVPLGRKLTLIRRAIRERDTWQLHAQPKPPQSARFLVAAVAASAPPDPLGQSTLPAAWWQLNQRWAWAMELFDRLERREQNSRQQDLYAGSNWRSGAD